MNKKVEVSRCSLMDFELSSKRPGRAKISLTALAEVWIVDIKVKHECKKKVSKINTLNVTIAMANNQSVRYKRN